MGDEDQGLLARRLPAAGLLGEPLQARVAARLGEQRGEQSLDLGEPAARGRGSRTGRNLRRCDRTDCCEGGGGGDRAGDQLGLLAPRHRPLGGQGAQPALELQERLPGRGVEVDRQGDARRQAADVGAPGGAGAGRQRLAAGQALLEALALREFLGAQQLEQAEEAVRVVLQRGGGEQQHVVAAGGDRRHRPVGLVAGVAGRPPQVVGLVDHQQVDAGRHRLLGEPAPARQQLQRDHRPAVDVEGVEVGAVVARHVGQALVVEQREGLVVFAPQLAQPLDDQGVGHHDEGALGAAGVEQPGEDQAGLDGLAEPHLVGQQPAHRIGGAGPLGGVELVGEEADAAAQEGAQAARLAQLQQAQAVEAVLPVLEAVDPAARQPFERRLLGGQRPRSAAGTTRPSDSRQPPPAPIGVSTSQLAAGLPARPGARRQHQRHQGVVAGRQAQGLAAAGTHLDRAADGLTTRPGPRPGFRRCERRSPGCHMAVGSYSVPWAGDGPRIGTTDKDCGPPLDVTAGVQRKLTVFAGDPFATCEILPSMLTVLCPVRGCGAALERRERSWRCPQGHAFDIARRGYCNLLQPQDRKSKNPGDPKAAALARRRLLEGGYGDFLLEVLQREIQGDTILDVGCGEGFFLGSLAGEREAHGVDLSVPAIDLAGPALARGELVGGERRPRPPVRRWRLRHGALDRRPASRCRAAAGAGSGRPSPGSGSRRG